MLTVCTVSGAVDIFLLCSAFLAFHCRTWVRECLACPETNFQVESIAQSRHELNIQAHVVLYFPRWEEIKARKTFLQACRFELVDIKSVQSKSADAEPVSKLDEGDASCAICLN